MNSLRTVFLASFALFLAACDSDNDSAFVPVPGPGPGTGSLQVLHASVDAPAVNVIVDGTELLSGVDYRAGSGRLELDVGTYSVQVDAIVPTGTATVLGPLDVTVAADTTYTIAAVGSVAAGTLDVALLEQPRTGVSAGSARAFVLHGAPDAPRVDVFVTTPGADLTATAPLGTFSFGESLGPVEVAAGDYQIRVTPEGAPGTVVYDTGTIPLGDGSDLFLTAVPDTVPATALFDAPISLVALDGTDASEILDVRTQAKIRVVHASPDAPLVDVIVDDTLELVGDLAFPNATPVVPVDPGTYNIKVTVADNPGVIAIEADLTFDAGVAYDILAVGPLAEIAPLVAIDDNRSIATAAKVRIVHASPTAQDVDIYVTAPGADITAETPTLTNIPFGANTGFLGLDAGSYDVTVVPAGTTTAAIGPATITIEAGGIYTAVARDATGGGAPLNLILLDDFED